MRFIIVGSPGAGKGTYSDKLAPKLGIAKISTGDIFRNAIDNCTELGNKIQGYVKNGSLVPDEIVIQVLQKRMAQPDCENGFILDGYPRTLNQAKVLEKMTTIDAIINLQVPEKILIAKLSGRWICKTCGSIYNVVNVKTTIDGVEHVFPSINPMVESKCDKCGDGLIQRSDDDPEVVKERLEVYKRQSRPLLEYYRERTPLADIQVTCGIVDIMINVIIKKLKVMRLIQ